VFIPERMREFMEPIITELIDRSLEQAAANKKN